MIATLSTVQRDLQSLRREVSRIKPPPVHRSPVEMAGILGLHLDQWQRETMETVKKEILMLASRQSGKSTVAALLATHQSVYTPGSLTLIVSPGERQSKLLLRACKRFLRELPEKPATIIENQLSIELANGSEIYALPGSEETVRGFSAVDLVIEDEASIVPDDLYQAVRPMVAVSGGKIVLLSTPRGKRGHFYHEHTSGGDSWHRAVATAHDCPRIDPEWLEAERAKIGEFWFRQEFLCEFCDTSDQLYSTDLVDAAISADVQPRALPAPIWRAA